MKTPAEIIDALGADAIAEKLDVAEKRVKRARYDRVLPASWYLGLCEMAGQELPRSLFTFKGIAA